MKAIIAVNNLGFIGKDNKLLWHSSGDLRHFKGISLGKTMLVGYNTYQTLPSVVKVRGVLLDDRNAVLQRIKTPDGDADILCIGGKKTYEKYCHMFTELYISHVDDNSIGDCTFPDLSNLNPDCKVFNYYFEVIENE